MEPSYEPTSDLRPESDNGSIADKKSLDKQDKDIGAVELQPVSSCVIGQTTGMPFPQPLRKRLEH